MNTKDISFFICDTCAFSTLSGRKEPPEKCDYYVPYENAHTGMEYSPRMLRKIEEAGGDIFELFSEEETQTIGKIR